MFRLGLNFIICEDGKTKNVTKKCKDKKIRFFFILESTMREYNWEEIYKYQMYEKKLMFTEIGLWMNDWVVVYE